VAFQVTPSMVAHVPSFALAASLAGYGFVRYRREGRRRELLTFILVMMGIALWQLGTFFRSGFTSESTTLLFINAINVVAVPLAAHALVLFALTFASVGRRYVRVVGVLLVVNVLAGVVAVALDPEFFYVVHGIESQGPVELFNVTFDEWLVLDRTLEPQFRLYQLYGYVLVLAGAGVLTRHAIRHREEVATGQVVALLVGLGTVVVANVLTFAGVVPPKLNLTDIALGVVSVTFGVAVFRYQLLDLTLVGRSQVVESMADPVVTLDEQDRVVDSNPAARELVDAGTDWRHTDAAEFFAPFPDQVEQFEDTTDVDTEVTVERDGQTRYFNLSISPIDAGGTEEPGRVVVLREFTSLKERERELDLLRQIQSRVLRHNVRNDLSIIKNRVNDLSRDADHDREQVVSNIASAADRLLSVSTNVQAAEDIVESDQTPVEIDLTTLLERKVQTYREMYPSTSFELSTPPRCLVETVPAMDHAIQNLVENAVEHNDATEPVVAVSARQRADAAVVTIDDNGPGIPEQELAVFEAHEETPLQHSVGAGLWVAWWAIEVSDATIAFDTGQQGTTVTIRIPTGRLR
jgi:signal transduction histidine kinase